MSASDKKSKKREQHQKKKTKESSAPIQYKWGIIIAIVAFALFANTIMHDYALDDSGAIIENQYVKEGFSGISKLMKVDFWHFSNIHLGYYRPLSLITFAIEYEFFESNPHVSHFFNVLIFSLSCFLLFIVLNKLFKSFHPAFAFVIALLFAAHPIHTEIVANIKGRDELLSFLNIMAMFWFFLKFQDNKNKLHLVAALVFCYLGMLSKETALTGVLVLPFLLYYYSELKFWDCAKMALFPLLIVGLFFIQKQAMLGTLKGTIPSDIVNYPYTDNAVKLPTTFLLFTFCLQLLVFPHPLRYDYSYNQVPAVHWNSPLALLGFVAFAVLVYIGFKQVQKKSVWGFAISIFYITLIPSLAFTILRGGIFAERFLFFPALGFCIALVYGVSLLLKLDMNDLKENAFDWLKGKIKLVASLSIIFVLYSIKTISRNADWKDNFTLFSNDIKTGENSAQIKRHYGNQLVYLANVEKDPVKKDSLGKEAIVVLKDALRIHPRFGEAYYLIGTAYHLITPNTDSAIYYYNKAIQHAPGYAIPYYNLGVIYQTMGKYNVASFYYNEAIKYNPTYIEPQVAAENLRKAGIDVHINPLATMIDTTVANKNNTYYYNLGNYYASQSDYTKAVESYSKSVELGGPNENVYLNLANCYGMLKQYDNCIAILNKVLEKNPNNKLALKNIAVTYNIMGNAQKANEYLERLKDIESKESKNLY